MKEEHIHEVHRLSSLRRQVIQHIDQFAHFEAFVHTVYGQSKPDTPNIATTISQEFYRKKIAEIVLQAKLEEVKHIEARAKEIGLEF